MTEKKAIPWWGHTFIEGLSKAISSVPQKFVGTSMDTLGMGCVAGSIIGTIQALSGLAGLEATTAKDAWARILIPSKKAMLWALLFGISAGLGGTVWSIYTFTLGADLTLRTLIIALSIIPTAFLGWVIWRDPFGPAQWAGIAVFLLAVWGMLDFAPLGIFLALPVWFFATLVNTGVQTANELIVRKSADEKLTAHANNFWVGTSTTFSCIVALVILLAIGETRALFVSDVFLGGVIVLGAITVVMIAFKLLAYAAGGKVAPKKVILYWTFLGGAYLLDIAVFDVEFSWGKTASVLVLFPIAATLTDKDAYRWFRSLHH